MGILGKIGGVRAPGAGAFGKMPVPGAIPPKSPNLDTLWGLSGFLYDAEHGGSPGTTYGFYRLASYQPFIASITQTRQNQAAPFFVPREDDMAPGMRVVLSDRSATMTDGAKKTAREIMGTLMAAAHGWNNYKRFGGAASAMLRDSLTFDQANAEILKTSKGKPYGFMPVDAASIRRTLPTEEEIASGFWYPGPDKPHYVKVSLSNPQEVVQEYNQDEMIFGIRNRRTDEFAMGYGMPELSSAHGVLAALTNAMTFNEVNFTSGIHANTIIAIHSTMKQDQRKSFGDAIRARMTGPRQSQRVPFFFVRPDDKVTAVKLGMSNKDMEFQNYMNFLLKVLCACYQMDPAELGFIMGAEGVTSALQTAGPGERILYSKERGFNVILMRMAEWFTDAIVKPLHPDFELQFVGLDAPSEDVRHKRLMEAARVYKTSNELRDMYDLKRLDHPAADIPLDEAFRGEMTGGTDEMGMPTEDEPFGKGVAVTDIDGITRAMVERAAGAVDEGRLTMPFRKSAMYRFLPSDKPGIMGHIINTDFREWKDPTSKLAA